MTDKEMCALFAKNLTNIMRDKSIKQADIVRELHVSKGSVSGWCAGLNIPRTDTLSKLIQMLDVDLSDLLADTTHPSAPTKAPVSPTLQALLDAVMDMDDDTARAVLDVVQSVKNLSNR